MAPNRISIACPHCDVVMKIRDEYAGKTIRCKNCRDVFHVPVYCERTCPGCRETLRFRSVYLNYTVACRKCQAQFWLDPIDRRAASRRSPKLGSSSEFPAAPAIPEPAAVDLESLRSQREAALADCATAQKQRDEAREALTLRNQELEKLRDRVAAVEDERTHLTAQPRPHVDAEGTLLDAELLTMPLRADDLDGPASPGFDPDQWQAELATARRNFETERAALAADAASLRDTVERERIDHDRERTALRKRTAQVEARFASLCDEAGSIRGENDALRAEIARRQAEGDDLQQRLTELESHRDEADRDHQAALARALDERDAARADLQQAEAVRTDRDRLRLQVDEQAAEADRMLARLAETEAAAASVEELRQRTEALSAQREAADRERQGFLDRHEADREDQARRHDELRDRLERQLDEARQALAARNAERDGLLARIERLESDHPELESARTRIREAAAERATIAREADRLRKRVVELETNQLASTNPGETLQGQLEALHSQRAELATPSALDGWRVRTRLWETERENQQAEDEELRVRLAAIMAERAALIHERDDRQRQTESLLKEQADWQADRLAIERRADELRDQAESARAENDTLRDAISRRQTDVDELQRRLADLESQRAEADRLREQVAGLEAERTTLTSQGDSLRGQLEDLQTQWTERESQQAEFARLRDRLTTFEAERDALIAERDGQFHRSESLAGEKAAWQADRLAMQRRITDAETETDRLKTEAQTAQPHGDGELVRELALNEIERERLEAALKRAETTIRQLREEKEKDRRTITFPGFDDDEDSFGHVPATKPPQVAQLEKELQASRAAIEQLRSQLYGLGINATEGF